MVSLRTAACLAAVGSAATFVYPHSYVFAATLWQVGLSHLIGPGPPEALVITFRQFLPAASLTLFFCFVCTENLGVCSAGTRRRAAMVAAVLMALGALFWLLEVYVRLAFGPVPPAFMRYRIPMLFGAALLPGGIVAYALWFALIRLFARAGELFFGPKTSYLAGGLVALTALQGALDTYGLWSRLLGGSPGLPDWGGHFGATLYRVVLGPALRTFEWRSLLLFALAVWRISRQSATAGGGRRPDPSGRRGAPA